MSIYVVELEGYQAGKRLYIKEICLIELNGHVYDHRFVTIPQSAQINDSTNKYVYRYIHGINFKTRLDKPLPRIPSKSILITHGLQKARVLARLYPHCTVQSLMHEKCLKNYCNVQVCTLLIYIFTYAFAIPSSVRCKNMDQVVHMSKHKICEQCCYNNFIHYTILYYTRFVTFLK